VTRLYYILDRDGNPLALEPGPYSLVAWAEWFQSHDRTIAFDIVDEHVSVSTVFLGLDHNFFGDGHPPVLWESLVIGGSLDGYQIRYTSREGALVGHRRIVSAVHLTAQIDAAPESLP
jgi:hypothetical protein